MSKTATTTSNPKDRIGTTKVPLHLIPLSAQIHAALAHFDGACKYGRYNWRQETVAAMIYVDACLRHIHKWVHGEIMDAESGVHHLGHAIACLNIILDAATYGNLIDDRPPADRSPSLLDTARAEVVRLLARHGFDIPSTPPINDEEKQQCQPQPSSATKCCENESEMTDVFQNCKTPLMPNIASWLDQAQLPD